MEFQLLTASVRVDGGSASNGRSSLRGNSETSQENTDFDRAYEAGAKAKSETDRENAGQMDHQEPSKRTQQSEQATRQSKQIRRDANADGDKTATSDSEGSTSPNSSADVEAPPPEMTGEVIGTKRNTMPANGGNSKATSSSADQWVMLSEAGKENAEARSTPGNTLGDGADAFKQSPNFKEIGPQKRSVGTGSEKTIVSHGASSQSGPEADQGFSARKVSSEAATLLTVNKGAQERSAQKAATHQSELKKHSETTRQSGIEAALEAKLAKESMPTADSEARSSSPAKQVATASGAIQSVGALSAPGVIETRDFDLQQVDGQDAEITSFKEARSQSSTGSTQLTSRAELTGFVGRQMAEALQFSRDQPVQIALSPKELGKVKLSIAFGEAGITVNVVAERQETLDLMRRNIQDLAREFHGIGYEAVDFAFSEGRSGDAESAEDDHSSSTDDDRRQTSASQLADSSANQEREVPLIQAEVSEGLDLRL